MCRYLTHSPPLRDLVPPAEMVASEARQMHMGPHLGPPLTPHANVLPGRAIPGPGEHSTLCLRESVLVCFSFQALTVCLSFCFSAGYGFLPSEPMETVARRQELIHKQNIAR